MECQAIALIVERTWGGRKMTKEEMIMEVEKIRERGYVDYTVQSQHALDMAIKALVNHPTTADCWGCNCPKIEQPRPIDPTVEVDLASGLVPRSALNRVENPPKVIIHTDRPKGHWVWYEVRGQMLPYCSECGNGLDVIYEYDFCPNCGADMRGNNND